MPGPAVPSPIVAAWLEFVSASRVLLAPRPDDRPLDQYLAFRDEVLALVQSDGFLAELAGTWPVFTDQPREPVGRLLLMELQAFPRAVEIAGTVASTESERKSWLRSLLGKSATVAGSVDDLLDNLPPLAKGGLKLFREAVDLFKGKD